MPAIRIALFRTRVLFRVHLVSAFAMAVGAACAIVGRGMGHTVMTRQSVDISSRSSQ